MALLEAVWIWAHSGTISSVQSMFCPGTGSALKILLYSTEGGMNICHAIWVSGSPVTTACQRRQSALFRISSRWLSVSLRASSASWRFVTSTITPARFHSPGPAGPGEWNLAGVIVDVTKRHEAEEARRLTESHLEEILKRADCLLWQAVVTGDPDTQIAWQ